MSCGTKPLEERAAGSAQELSALRSYDDPVVTGVVDRLEAAISLNELADCLVAAKNEPARSKRGKAIRRCVLNKIRCESEVGPPA